MKKNIAQSYNKIAKEYVTQHGYGENLALPSLKSFIKRLSSGARVLEVGCGGGQDSKVLVDNGFDVLGIDISSAMIKLAKKYVPAASFKVLDLMNLSTKNKFDGIWCCRVFHHVSLKEQNNFLKKLHDSIKKDGLLYITAVVSNTKKDYEAHDSGNDNLLKKRLTAQSFKTLLKNNRFKVLRFKYWVGKKGMEAFGKVVLRRD